MRNMAFALTAVALLAGCARGDSRNRPDPTSPLTAPTYMQAAASSDLFEIRSSELALQRSQNSAVRAFARMLVADHTRMSNEMKTAASAAGLTPPAAVLRPHHTALLVELQSTGRGFDLAYRNAQVASHRAALLLHRDYAKSGDHEALRPVATRAVPVVEAHLKESEALLGLL